MLPDQAEANLRVENLTLQCSRLAGIQVLFRADRIVVGPDENDLFAACFTWRHFQRPAQAVGQGEPRSHAPGVTAVEVVVRDA